MLLKMLKDYNGRKMDEIFEIDNSIAVFYTSCGAAKVYEASQKIMQNVLELESKEPTENAMSKKTKKRKRADQ